MRVAVLDVPLRCDSALNTTLAEQNDAGDDVDMLDGEEGYVNSYDDVAIAEQDAAQEDSPGIMIPT